MMNVIFQQATALFEVRVDHLAILRKYFTFLNKKPIHISKEK